MDVDADGSPDILTARAKVDMFGPGRGDLVYLTPKDRSRPQGEWVEHIIGPHADTFVAVEDLNGDGVPEIISAEFWGGNLTVISTNDPKGSFADASKLSYNVIANDMGSPFDVELVDLNGDGKKDILVTNHQEAGKSVKGMVIAFEVPRDTKAPSSAWTRVRIFLLLVNFYCL